MIGDSTFQPRSLYCMILKLWREHSEGVGKLMKERVNKFVE